MRAEIDRLSKNKPTRTSGGPHLTDERAKELKQFLRHERELNKLYQLNSIE